MSATNKHNHSGWIYGAKHHRRHDVVILNNKIVQNRLKDGSNFETMELYYPGQYMTGTDIYFIYKNDVLFNAFLNTVQSDLDDRISSLAINAAHDMLPKEELKKYMDTCMETTPCKYNAFGQPVMYSVSFNETKFPQFDNRTMAEQYDYLEGKIYKDTSIIGKEYVTLDPSYRYGIGLIGVVNERYLTIEKINAFIERVLNDNNVAQGIESIRKGMKGTVTIPWGQVPESDIIRDKNWFEESIFKYGTDEQKHWRIAIGIQGMIAVNWDKYAPLMEKLGYDRSVLNKDIYNRETEEFFYSLLSADEIRAAMEDRFAQYRLQGLVF